MSKTDLAQQWDPRDLDDDAAEYELHAQFESDLRELPDEANYELGPGFGAYDEPDAESHERESLGQLTVPSAAPAMARGGPEPRSVLAFEPQDQGSDAPVPRITIAAYCDRPDTAQLIEAAGRDRRLAKATITAEVGGVRVALERLKTHASPNLLILDSTANPDNMLAELDMLAEVVDANTKAIVIGGVNDIGLYRELMRRGVSEYLVAPLGPLQLIRTISRMFADPDKPFVGRVTAVVGAKGGVGASTIAHNLAWTLAERFQANTTLVDLDVSFGTASLNFDEDADQGVGEALAKAEQLDSVFLERLLVRHSEHLSILPATAALDRGVDADASAFETLISQARFTAPHIVLDLPHLWSGWIRQALISADDMFIVTTLDLAGLRNAKNIFDIAKQARPHDVPPIVVINMAGVPRRPEIPVRDFAKALEVEPAAIIPFDPGAFGQAANSGKMLMSIAPSAKPSQALDALARRLVGRAPAPRKRTSLMSRLPAMKR